MEDRYDITAVISTYNRAEMLPEVLESVLNQQSDDATYEVIVVDNNSIDSTREIVEVYIARGHRNLRYLFEPKQGSSYARNAGTLHARSEIVAFADDDIRVGKDWVATIKRAFDDYPEVDCIGGKVLPVWRVPPPRWLTRDHWMPLALQDYGDRLIATGLSKPLCLVSANLAFRRKTIIEIGLFSPDLQRVKGSIGSMEDAELLERYWRSGRTALYLPNLIVETNVTAERLTKSYHRRWHRGHGYFFAIKRSPEIDGTPNKLFDVPAHLYKQAVVDAVSWLIFLFGNRSLAFLRETRLNFFCGFVRKRRADYYATTTYRGLIRDVLGFVSSCVTKKAYVERCNSDRIAMKDQG